MFTFLKETYHRLIANVSLQNYRYLYAQFHIKNRLTGLVGQRGVGKTTLLLQFIKNNLFDEGKTFYFSADNIYFNQNTLLDFVADLHRAEGMTIFFIDEIHKYSNWNQELKNLYDAFPNIKIIFSGSSMLDLVGGSHDLSRRVKCFSLHGMSFREYLAFTEETALDPISYEELLKPTATFEQAAQRIEKLPTHFQNYLEHGYYPFVFEDPHSYDERLLRIVDKSIYEDIANYYQLKTPNLHLFKKILIFLSSIPPGNINTHHLAQNLGVDHKTAFHYLSILESVNLVRFLYPYDGGNIRLRKPEKVYLNNTTLFSALQKSLGEEKNKGNERELYFYQALSDAETPLFYSGQGDFRTKGERFEVGGKNKTRRQLQGSDLPAYLIKDGIYASSKGVIPLHYCGFLY